MRARIRVIKKREDTIGINFAKNDIMKLQKLIAKAIKKADSSYFFEDYSKQSKAVLDMLDAEGYHIIPKELDKDLYKKISDEMRTGRMAPEEHIRDVYQTMFRILKARGYIS